MGIGKIKFVFITIAFFLLLGCSSKKKYEVSVETDPDDSSFWLDGKFQGYTPKKVSLSGGRHTFSFEKENYLRYEKTVSVNKNDSLQFSLNPEEIEVEFKFNEKPEVFYIDSKKVEAGLVKLPYKKIHIFAFKQKYEIYEADILPKKRIFINLKPSKNGKILLKVSEPSEFYISNYYIQDLSPSKDETFFMEADTPIDMSFKPKDKAYFDERIATSVASRRLLVLKINFTKERQISIHSDKERDLQIRSKGEKVMSLIFTAGETKKVRLLEKEYTLDMGSATYDRMIKTVKVSELADFVDLDSLFKGGLYNEKNRH